MKLKLQLVAVLFTAASATLAMACGCSSEKIRVEPVRERIISHDISSVQLEPVQERIITRTACPVQQPVISKRTTYVPECPSCYWVPPSTSNPAYVIGNVLTAPFRLVTGRQLGQPDVVSTQRYSETMHRVNTMTTTRSTTHINQCGEMSKKVTISNDSMLEPVGERLTTVKVIRTKPMLQPVGEKTLIQTTRVYSQPSLCEDNPYR